MIFALRHPDAPAPGIRPTPLTSLVAIFILVLSLAATTTVSAQKNNDINVDFEKCRVLGDDQARFACLKKLLPEKADGTAAYHPVDSWPLVRTPHPQGGPDAVSIMRTADTTRSDPELAGLMIRCAEKSGLEAILALLRPIPPRSRRDVVLTVGATEVLLHAEVTAAGTALVLPIEPSTFTTKPWRDTKEIAVTIRDPDGEIRGVILLGGIGPGMAKLSANCPPR